MKPGRLLIGVGLLGIVFTIAVWLMVRGSEFPRTNAKPPPTSLMSKRTARRSPPAIPEETEEAVPGMPAEKNGQLLLDMLAGVTPIRRPSAAAIELYLQQHGRSAASLLAAWQVSGNLDHLREAATRFENDPRVQFVVLATDAFPDDRSKWIALFKQSSLYNPLANYFAAHEYFRQNQTDQAVGEMVAASSKQGFENYMTAAFQECEELFLATGASPIDAKAEGFAAVFLMLQPYVETMRDLGQAAAGAQAAYAAAGDSASAQDLAKSGVDLGRQMNLGGGGRLLISQMTGISIEEMFLKQLPPDEPLDWLGQSPAARLAQLQQQREQIETLSAACQSALPQLGEAEFGEYVNRLVQFRELDAMQWLASRKQGP
ncbi:MAG: hypothetical protein ABSA97_12645 [Verrucomicrobiia bacterium]